MNFLLAKMLILWLGKGHIVKLMGFYWCDFSLEFIYSTDTTLHDITVCLADVWRVLQFW